MAPYHQEFSRLKAGEDTRKIAQSLYLQASELTKPGSGRSLGQGQSALPAVCAFLASKRLGNGEVTKDQACAVACVDPKTFDSTLAIVQSVLRPSRSSPRLNQPNVTYRSLSKQFVAREDAYIPMAEVEESLKGCALSVDGSPIDPNSSLMQCAIFYWVCTFVLQVPVPNATHLRQMLKVSPKAWSGSQRVLENHCSHMMEDLIRKAATALSARATRTQRPTRSLRPTTDRVRALTNLSAPGLLTPPKSVVMDEERKDEVSKETPSRPTQERVQALTNSLTPSLLTPPKSVVMDVSMEIPSVRPTKQRVQVVVNSSLLTPPKSVVMDDEESENEANETIVVRSARSVRKQLDRSAWHLQMPVVEEISRRRRRNLRAAFLNPGVYGWKPAPHTAKKLERARNWESLMIGKYGDPWDAW